jgi:CRISPR-associated protein Cas1
MEVLNTLYVTTPQSYVHLDHDTVRIENKKEGISFQIPLLHLMSIVCFGSVSVSPQLIHRCAKDGRSIVLLDFAGHFSARIEGPVSGNVLLRKAQYRASEDRASALAIARNVLAGKLQNTRQVLLHAARDREDQEDRDRLAEGAGRLAQIIRDLEGCKTLEEARGHEGEGARIYFQAFSAMIRQDDRAAFALSGRNRRPPLDRMNALLSFIYTLLRTDCVAALESVGLDPQVGFLHALRPGRPALALDLMEELRYLADRLALSLVNRHQVGEQDFEERAGGAVYLKPEARKTVIASYQARKQDKLRHQVANQTVSLGLVAFIQARLLARHLRGDMPAYPPFLSR